MKACRQCANWALLKCCQFDMPVHKLSGQQRSSRSAYLIQNIMGFKNFFGMPQQQVSNLYIVEWQRLKDGLMSLLLGQHICLHNKKPSLGALQHEHQHMKSAEGPSRLRSTIDSMSITGMCMVIEHWEQSYMCLCAVASQPSSQNPQSI